MLKEIKYFKFGVGKGISKTLVFAVRDSGYSLYIHLLCAGEKEANRRQQMLTTGDFFFV